MSIKKGESWKKWEALDIMRLLIELQINTTQAAAILGVSQITIYRWARRGQVPVGTADKLKNQSGSSDFWKVVLVFNNEVGKRGWVTSFAENLSEGYGHYLKEVRVIGPNGVGVPIKPQK